MSKEVTKKPSISVYLNSETIEDIKDFATKEHRSISNFIELVLIKYMRDNQPKE